VRREKERGGQSKSKLGYGKNRTDGVGKGTLCWIGSHKIWNLEHNESYIICLQLDFCHFILASN
jgi:hypothetical protein